MYKHPDFSCTKSFIFWERTRQICLGNMGRQTFFLLRKGMGV